MPRILSRDPMSSRRLGNSISARRSQASAASLWGIGSVEIDGSSAISRYPPGAGHSSISSGWSDPMSANSSTSSKMRRSSSMSFDGHQQQEETLISSHRNILPPLYPTARDNEVADSWGHFVDVADADDEIIRYSRVLSAKAQQRVHPDTIFMVHRR